MTKRYFSGATEAQAVLEGATHFGVEPTDLAFEPVSRKGSLRARTKSIIAVDEEAPTLGKEEVAPEVAPEVAEETPVEVSVEGGDVAAPTVAPVTEAAEVASDESGSDEAPADVLVEEAAVVDVSASEPAVGDDEPEPEPVDPVAVKASVLQTMELLLDLADLDVDATVELGEREGRVNLTGPDREWLLDGEGELLLAFEHLAGRMLYRCGCPQDRVRVDSDGFREGLEEALRERARKALVESRESGRPVTFEPLGPAERRVIHLAIESEGGGKSRSEGSGFRRRVRIEGLAVESEDASEE